MKNPSRIALSVLVVSLLASSVQQAHADPITARWPQPAGPGTDVWITYSYSNLLDGTLLMLTPGELRAATAEAMGVWARYAPLHFIEMPDSGPAPSDDSYAPGNTPQIRVGHHPMLDLAHAFFPHPADGLGGDVHFDSGIPWTVGTGHWNFLEAITHELGHSLGLAHIENAEAIMNTMFPQRRFGALGTAFLLPPDIAAIQLIYGAGSGSVDPLDPIPEPTTVFFLGTGLAVVGGICRRRRQLRSPANDASG